MIYGSRTGYILAAANITNHQNDDWKEIKRTSARLRGYERLEEYAKCGQEERRIWLDI